MHRLRHVSDALRTGIAAAQPDELLHAETHRRSLNLLAKAADPAAEPWRSLPPLQLSAEQLAFFDQFGYLSLPGLLADRADQICRDFEAVWEEYGGGHGGKPHDPSAGRSCIVPFLDSHPNLCSLLDDPRIDGLATSLLGEECAAWPLQLPRF